METIIVAAILLIALIVIVLIFREHIFRISGSYGDVAGEAEDFAKANSGSADQCKIFFGNRDCYDSSCPEPPADAEYAYVVVSAPTGDGWKDCKSQGRVCCERQQT